MKCLLKGDTVLDTVARIKVLSESPHGVRLQLSLMLIICQCTLVQYFWLNSSLQIIKRCKCYLANDLCTYKVLLLF